MPDADTVQEIVSPLLARHGAGKAAIVVVAHAGDEAPAELMGEVEKALRDAELKALRVRYSELSLNPVRGLVWLDARGTDVFSIVIDSKVLKEEAGKLITALNIHRNTYADKGICAVFWLPAWGLRAFTDRASNFLDFRTRLLELDLDGRSLDPSAESPRFFVPPPPPLEFFKRHGADIDRLTDLLRRYDRVAVIGRDYHGWPGGTGALVKACLSRERQAFVAAGGAFWIDAAADDWLDRLADLAPKLGADGNSTEARIEGIAKYLQAHPGALIIYDAVREPDALKTILGGERSVLELGGKVLVTTSRRDLSPREFPASQVIDIEYELESAAKGLELLHTLKPTMRAIQISWSPDGQWLAAVSHETPGEVLIWNSTTHVLKWKLTAGTWELTSLAWAPDGRRLAIGSDSGSIAIWNIEDSVARWADASHQGRVFSLTWSPDRRSLASGSGDSTIGIWDVDGVTAELADRWQGHSDGVRRVSWSPDGSKLASGSTDQTVQVWDAVNGELLHRLEGHTDSIEDVAWSPDGRVLISASLDKTLRIWNPDTGQQRAALERHSTRISSVSFSHDGRIFASSGAEKGLVRELGGDQEMIIWRFDTLQPSAAIRTSSEHSSQALTSPSDKDFIEVRLEPTPDISKNPPDALSFQFKIYFSYDKPLAFHPHQPILAASSLRTGTINIWRLDFDVLLDAKPSATSAQYTNAKVVLVGDTGVGKSGLGLVLTGKPFQSTDSTHGRRVWTFARHEVELPGERWETRETLLWDLAGQAGYRLVHQLHLGEVAVALVVFDARSETDPFAGVRYWDRALRQAQRARGDAAVAMKKILVAARADRGSIPVSRSRIDDFVRELGFDAYFETSAKEGWGIPDLTAAIESSIDWGALPQVSSTELFADIKAFLLEEKEAGRLLSTVEELYARFLETSRPTRSVSDLKAQFETCIGRVESRGLIRKLSFGDLVLLQPELLDAYASAMVDAARAEPDGLGCIEEEVATAGRLRIPADERLDDDASERILLTATVEELLRHEIALREEPSAAAGALLVFPSQFTRDWPEAPNPEGQDVVFEFEGPVLSVYTTLIVRLARSRRFEKRELWQNAALFTAREGGQCGVWLQEIEEGRGRLTLFYSPEASEETRSQFEEYVEVHLKRRALPESLERRRIFACPACGTPLTEMVVRRRLRRGVNWLACPVCETRISLEDRPERTADESVVLDIDRSADARRDRDAAAAVLRGKKATGDFDLFVAHDPDDRAEVEALVRKLETRGLHSWLELDRMSPERWLRDVIEREIPKVRAVAVAIGQGGLRQWQVPEVQSFIDRSLARRLVVIVVVLPGVGELTPAWLSLQKVPKVTLVQDTEDVKMLDWLEFRLTGHRPHRTGR